MSPPRPPDYYADLARELCRLPKETEWVEFKRNQAAPESIGKYVSALSNSATQNEKPAGYVVWGVEDGTHEILGTTFRPETKKKGNEPLEAWLLRVLEPHVPFRFHSLELDGKRVVLLEIECATNLPIAFAGTEYIRVGEVTKPLRKVPEQARALWLALNRQQFAELHAAEHVSTERALKLLDFPAYFELLDRPLPEGRKSIMAALSDERLVRPCPAGGWDITNLGATLLARNLEDFPSLGRKAMRVVQYRGAGRIDAVGEKIVTRGYAAGFDHLVDHVATLLPHHETIERFVRKDIFAFPMPAVRELIINALVHQDFMVTGSGPMVEIFSDRIEITNPGAPLVPTDRLIDHAPRSRNEALAGLMRRFGFCEERGSGIDNVMELIEEFRLPAPRFERFAEATRVTVFSSRELQALSKAERIDACYWHACLCYINSRSMTNATLRNRLGIAKQNSAKVSRLMREAVEAGAIVVRDLAAGTRNRTYLPYWADENGAG